MKKLIIYGILGVVTIVGFGIKQGLFTKEDVVKTGTQIAKQAIDTTKEKLDNISEEDIQNSIEKGVEGIEKTIDQGNEIVKQLKGEGNTENDSFSKSKNILLKQIYGNKGTTLYCGCKFSGKNIDLKSCGYQGIHDGMKERSKKLEWEHVVPAENFGKSFSEWRDGHKDCVDSKGKSFKGRKCAEKVNQEYRLMQSDMYNLFPAVGEVNALRSNLDHGMIAGNDYQTFGDCGFKYSKSEKKVEPTDDIKGIIARTYLYMNSSYSKKILSDQSLKLYEAWNKQFPVTKDECLRYEKIKSIQKNENVILKESCTSAGFLQ